MNKSKHGAGFTMVEVLVSMVIFSVGLIGIAKMQVVAKQSNYDAVQRVAATSIAEDLLSRMRSNHEVLSDYVSNTGSTTIGSNSISTEPTPTCSSGSTCTANQLVSHDLWEIEQLLDGATELDTSSNKTGGINLPTLCITGDAAGGSGVYTVTVAWRGKAALSNLNTNTCGASSGQYGNNNEYRRLLVMQAYITNL